MVNNTAAPSTEMVVILNGDWTKNKKATALDKTCQVIENIPTASLVAISEVIGGTAAALGESLSYRTGKNFTSVGALIGYDHIAIAYDTDVWEEHHSDEYTCPIVGKHIGVILRHKEVEKYVLFVAVHMPHKKNKIGALESVKEFADGMINNCGYYISSAVLMGDWNTIPTKLGQYLEGYDLVLGEDILTTKHSAIDNFALWNCSAVEYYIDTENEMFSHHPISLCFTVS